MSDGEFGAKLNLKSLPSNDADAVPKPTGNATSIFGGKVVEAAASYLLVSLSVAAATAVFVYCRRWISVNEAPLFYLPVVMACAVRLGFGAALFAAVTCFLSWDYFFLVPYHTLQVESPSSWVSIIVFLITALTTGSLAAKARERERIAAAGEKDMAILLSASELVSRSVHADEILSNLVREASDSFKSFSVILKKDDQTSHLISLCSYGKSDDIKNAVESISAEALAMLSGSTQEYIVGADDGLAKGLYTPIQYQGKPIGVLFVGTGIDESDFSASQRRLLASLAGYAGVAIARKGETIEMEARVRQSAILEERHRLAQEVHDTLSNTFNSIKFMLEAAKRGQSPNSISGCIDVALRLSIEGAQEARRSVQALRPVAFDNAGNLSSAIRRIASSIPDDGKLKAETSIVGEPRYLAETTENNILRIAQEAFNNARDHADATKVVIMLKYAPNLLELTIEDNGQGFDPVGYESEGYGLENMRSRSQFIDASIVVDSAVGRGTKVTVSVPLHETIVDNEAL